MEEFFEKSSFYDDCFFVSLHPSFLGILSDFLVNPFNFCIAAVHINIKIVREEVL